MLKTIVKKGDPVLEKKCHAVTKFDDKLACLLDDMTQTLAQSGGVGLHGQQRDHQQQRQQRGGCGAEQFVFHRMFPPQPMVRWPTVTWAACTTSVMVTLPSPLMSAALA